MKINSRLKTIASLVPKDSYPLDIGCDHAMLSIYLVKECNFSKVVASDDKEGPLLGAKKNIDFYHVKKNIQLIQADGLEAYQDGVDVITISGMGGILISQIFEKNKDVLEKVNTIILSPNNHTPLVRKELTKCGYRIEDELLVKENKITYPILVFKKGRGKYHTKDYYLGPVLSTKKEEIIYEYYAKELKDQYQILLILPTLAIKRKFIQKRKIRWLKKVLKKFKK